VLAVDPALLQRLAVVVALLGSVVAVAVLDARRTALATRLRRRLILGVPWGTLLTAGGVLAVYLFLQGGATGWRTPATIPFRAWSFFYPLGVVTSPFAHSGPNHLLGNLVGTLALAPVVEYAVGHYPRERGAHSFGSLRQNPYARALAVPGAAVVVGLVTGAVAVGPVIGFSGVVFAFAGAGLAIYPIRTVVALAAARVGSLAAAAVRTPVTVARAEPTFSSPWWADVAVQGHAVGLLAGVLVGVWLGRRGVVDRPSPLRTYVGVLLFGVAQSLWAVYWFRGEGEFVLYRAVGLALVALLGLVVAGSVAASARPLLGSGPAGESLRTIPRWQAASVVLLLAFATLAGPGVAVNLATTSDDPLPGDPVVVRDYEVTYAEDVENGMVSVVDVEAFGETTRVTTSGVIVRSERRHAWLTAVPKSRLAFAGRTVVRVGGVGWQDRVVVTRRGWNAVGGNATYRVTFGHDNTTRVVYRAPPANASPTVDGRNVTIRTAPPGFRVAVTYLNQTRSAPVPTGNATTTVFGLTFERDGRDLVATRNDTRVAVATEERYPGAGRNRG
jgi:membrane associated rhomboid family serine protease